MQGRFQKISESPKVIFDAAHNLEGVKVFIKLFKKEFKNYKTCTLIYGALNDKNNKQMLTLLQSYFIKVYVTSINNERSETTKNLISITKSLKMDASKTNYPEKIISAFIKNKNRNQQNCLVVLGSIYLLGEIKIKLSKI